MSAWKDKWAGTGRNWLRSFVAQKYGTRMDASTRGRLVVYCSKCHTAYARSQTRDGYASGRVGQGRRATGHRCNRVPARRRLRESGAGRPESCPSISVELFQYWVDRAATLHCRVASTDLMQHATVLLLSLIHI